MSLADDLYVIGLKLEDLKTLRPEKDFSIENKENRVGPYFIIRLDGNTLSLDTASECVDIAEALRLQYVAENNN